MRGKSNGISHAHIVHEMSLIPHLYGLSRQTSGHFPFVVDFEVRTSSQHLGAVGRATGSRLCELSTTLRAPLERSINSHYHIAMAKLYFHYSTMNAGKSTVLLQAAHNYVERGMQPYLITAQFDNRAGHGRIGSRIGIEKEADTFAAGEDLFAKIKARKDAGPCACVFIDEAQFLEAEQVWQLARAVDDLGIPVMCFGLRVDFRGQLFPGSATLLALADEMREIRTICHCGKKATMVVRQDADGHALRDGAQVQIGGNETYVSLCRRHWRAAVGDS